jgi:fumarate reductase flavoprotein subunit
MDGTAAQAREADKALAGDVLVVGAGTAGLPTAIFAARRGARVIVADAADDPGGTLRRAAGHVSAGGTRLQREKGIADDPAAHAADIARITGGTADPEMVALACDLAPRTVAWLDELGLDWAPECPAILHALEAYSVPRTYWGRNRARSIAEVLVPEFDRARDAGQISFLPGHRLEDLEVSRGIVTGGILCRRDGQRQRVRAAQTVLTSGGYTANPTLFAEMTQGLPLVGGAEPTNTGGGLMAARAIGAAMRPARHFLPHVGGIEDPPGSRRTSRADNPVLMPARAPWELYVDRTGRRCLREDEPDRVTQQRAMTRVPDMTFWIVWDAAIAAESPPLLPSWQGARLDAAWNVHPSFSRGDSLPELAHRAGIDPEGLSRTVAAYNAAVEDDTPDPLGRRHRPAPIATPPFYAVRNHGTTATSSGGVKVDRDCRVLHRGGHPIPGLFAAGEILGRELLSGNAFVGGMSITPALAFGRRLGEVGLVW